MADDYNVFLGIVAIILGILIIAFPLISIFTLSVLVGIGILFLGIWFFVQASRLWTISKAVSIAYLILGIIAIVAGIGTMGNVYALSFLASFIIYLTGFFLLISGILTLFTGVGSTAKGIGGLGVVLGILFLIIGVYALNPIYLAFIIGIWLIFDGISLFFVSPTEPESVPEQEEST